MHTGNPCKKGISCSNIGGIETMNLFTVELCSWSLSSNNFLSEKVSRVQAIKGVLSNCICIKECWEKHKEHENVYIALL